MEFARNRDEQASGAAIFRRARVVLAICLGFWCWLLAGGPEWVPGVYDTVVATFLALYAAAAIVPPSVLAAIIAASFMLRHRQDYRAFTARHPEQALRARVGTAVGTARQLTGSALAAARTWVGSVMTSKVRTLQAGTGRLTTARAGLAGLTASVKSADLARVLRTVSTSAFLPALLPGRRKSGEADTSKSAGAAAAVPTPSAQRAPGVPRPPAAPRVPRRPAPRPRRLEGEAADRSHSEQTRMTA